MRHLQKIGANPGVPTPKRGEAIAALVEDILAWPVLNEDGVSWDGNFVFNPGTSFLKIYMTPATQKALLESGGSADAYGTKGKFTGEYPGTPKEALIWAKKHNSKGFIIFYGGCDTEEYKTLGTSCLPMILQVSMEDNNEKNFMTLSFEQEMLNDQYIRFYSGNIDISETNTVVPTKVVTLSKANGYKYQLPTTTVTDAITATNTNLENGSTVTFIGGGGTAPLTLANQPTAATAVLLKSGASWSALKDSTISFKVVVSDKTYLIEVART